MTYKNKSGFIFGILSGLLWAIYLFILDSYYSDIFYDLFFSSLVLFSLNELFALIWLTLSYRGTNIVRLLAYQKTMKNRWWLFSISPIGMLFYTLAIIASDSVTVAIVSSIYPILTVFLTKFILDKKVTKFHYFLAILSFSGIILFSSNSITEIEANPYGIIFSFLCAICWAGESILCRYYSEVNIDTNSLLSMKYITSIIMGVFIFIIYCFFKSPPNISFIYEYKYLLLISIISLLSYIFYYKSIGIIGSVYALNLNVTYILWIMLFTAFSTGIDIYSILGSVTILISILLISKRKDNV